MTTEELLRPRYKVIADYPGSIFTTSDIVEFIKDTNDPRRSVFWLVNKKVSTGQSHEFFEHYPHLFRKLQWWEERKDGDIEYVKRSGRVFKFSGIELWDTYPEKIGAFFLVIGEYDEIASNGSEPATHEEYLQYINREKIKP
jgi:hypothetical protein